MKIAITAQGTDLNSELDSRFGRAKQFIIVDSETKEFEIINNEQNLNAAQGAGIQSGQNIINSGAEALITGHCGPKAYKVLNAGDVKIYYAKNGIINELLDKLKNNELQLADSADVEGHWV